MYFESCRTFPDLRLAFKKYALSLHPDKQGGNNEAFRAMFDEYSAAKYFFCSREKTPPLEEPVNFSSSLRSPTYTSRWSQFSQEDLWAIMREELKRNEESVAAMNSASLRQENEFDWRNLTNKEKQIRRTDYDCLGQVAQMRIEREGTDMDGLLSQMQAKRKLSLAKQNKRPKREQQQEHEQGKEHEHEKELNRTDTHSTERVKRRRKRIASDDDEDEAEGEWLEQVSPMRPKRVLSPVKPEMVHGEEQNQGLSADREDQQEQEKPLLVLG